MSPLASAGADAYKPNGFEQVHSMKRRSLGEVIALTGLPAETLDETAPINDGSFGRKRELARGNWGQRL